MSSYHTVEQGEYLSSIAAEYGFADYTVIWNHADNAQLKALRKNPNVLLPGDSLFIPDKEQKLENGATSKRHTFEVNNNSLMLRLTLEDAFEKPIASAPCTLSLDQQTLTVNTSGQGKLEEPIPHDAQKGTLVIASDQTPFQDDPLVFRIGHLDPVDSMSGQRARLNNLGYLAGSSDDPQAKAFLSAVEEFQCDHGLTVDGSPGPGTQAKLLQIHGC